MTVIRYIDGVNEAFDGWTIDTMNWALVLATYSPDPVTARSWSSGGGAPAPSELTDVDYSQQTLTTPAKTLVYPATTADPGRIDFTCDSPDFGVLSGGEIAGWLALYASGTLGGVDDPLIAMYQVAYNCNGGASATFPLPGNRALSFSTVSCT